ncbi:MAG: PEP-CTERM sorting domain-containing protein [Verrucomicrobiota bacterium JB022]|nr:PEP-CTERM sorting domain-containing protein [Verrucomicrobiota bacterium JB022]
MSIFSQSRSSLSFGAAIGFSFLALVAQANAAIEVFPVNAVAQDTLSGSSYSAGASQTVSDLDSNTLFSLRHTWRYIYGDSENSHTAYFTTGQNVRVISSSQYGAPTFLEEGASIGTGVPFYSKNDTYFAGNMEDNAWHTTSSTSGYMGFRITDVESGGYNYGWISISITYPGSRYDPALDGNGYVTINSYAIETELNKPILAGDMGVVVPEPTTTAALLGLGAGAFVFLRRKRAR